DRTLDEVSARGTAAGLLDLRRIRDDPDGVRAALARRAPELAASVDEVLRADSQWRGATASAENLRATQRASSESIAAGKKAGVDVSSELTTMKQLSGEVKALTEQSANAKEHLDELLARLPNLPDPSAAEGPEDEEVRRVGEPPSFSFSPRDHLELAGQMIDTDHAAKLSGARFAYLRGDLVMLELALVGWALRKLRERGFQPVIPPVLVRERALYGTGFL